MIIDKKFVNKKNSLQLQQTIIHLNIEKHYDLNYRQSRFFRDLRFSLNIANLYQSFVFFVFNVIVLQIFVIFKKFAFHIKYFKINHFIDNRND